VFGQDAVRTALASQLSTSLGQPVTIGRIGASIYPQLTVNLGAVTIGSPARIQIETLHVGTNLRALLSRRIEHAVLKLTGAHVDLPLPAFALGSSDPAASNTAPRGTVEIVSVDEIVLNDVAIRSGTRTVQGDVELVPHGGAVTVRKMRLTGDNTSVDITGEITDIAGPTGQLTAHAGAINFDRLLAFVTDFAARAGFQPSRSTRAASQRTGQGSMNIVIALAADSATIGELALQKLSGRARVTSDVMRLEPIRFGVFGGTYEGTLQLSLGQTTDFQMKATLAGVDMAAATAFMGSPDTITGRLAAHVDLSGRGLDPADMLRTARGNTRVDITNGIVKRLGLIRTVVVAMSGRSDTARQSSASGDEPFARLGATLAIANGTARTQDLTLESNDLVLRGAGTVRLDGSAIDVTAQAQLSDELSKQAGRDLLRYTQEGGRVTLPLTITGSATSPQVRIDVVSATKRAIVEGLRGIFRR
jgi:uncharacterized protein involved in outer membrane biogenesis